MEDDKTEDLKLTSPENAYKGLTEFMEEFIPGEIHNYEDLSKNASLVGRYLDAIISKYGTEVDEEPEYEYLGIADLDEEEKGRYISQQKLYRIETTNNHGEKVVAELTKGDYSRKVELKLMGRSSDELVTKIVIPIFTSIYEDSLEGDKFESPEVTVWDEDDERLVTYDLRIEELVKKYGGETEEGDKAAALYAEKLHLILGYLMPSLNPYKLAYLSTKPGRN